MENNTENNVTSIIEENNTENKQKIACCLLFTEYKSQ